MGGIPATRRIALAAAAAPILVLTLAPGPPAFERIGFFCVVCGSRGLADAILNVALFVPLGVAVGGAGRGLRFGLAAGLAFSLGIELAQFAIPNRYPTLGDVLWNGLGTMTGVALWGVRERLLRPDPGPAGRLTLAWVALGVVLAMAAAWMLRPSFPESGWIGRWTVDLPGLERYAGEVLEVSIGGVPLPDGGPAPPEPVRRLTDGGATIDIAFVAATPPDGLAAIVSLLDAPGSELFTIGVDDRDLVVRYRTASEAWTLGRPDYRVEGAVARWAVGDTVRLSVAGISNGIRVRDRGTRAPAPDRAGSDPGRESSSLDRVGAGRPDWEIMRVPSARSWALLLYPPRIARRAGVWIDLVWMALLAIPLGLWGGPRLAAPAAGVWVAALVVVSGPAATLSPSVVGCCGVALGTGSGLILRRIARR